MPHGNAEEKKPIVMAGSSARVFAMKYTPNAARNLPITMPVTLTGAVMSAAEMEEIAAVLRETNVVVLSDEIYSELTYGLPDKKLVHYVVQRANQHCNYAWHGKFDHQGSYRGVP